MSTDSSVNGLFALLGTLMLVTGTFIAVWFALSFDDQIGCMIVGLLVMWSGEKILKSAMK
jgi:hypothetical protein